MATTVSGTDLLMFVETTTNAGTTTEETSFKAVACAQSSTLSGSTEFIEATCKGSGGWREGAPGRQSWTMSTDGLYQPDSEVSVIDFMDLWLNKTKVKIAFGMEGSGNVRWSGFAYLTQPELSGSEGESATYSVNFEGTGALTKETIV